MLVNQIDEKFWLDPPWLRHPQKYNLGLKPIKLKDWLASNPSDEIINHKKKLLSTNYEHVVSTVNHPDKPEFILSKHFWTWEILKNTLFSVMFCELWMNSPKCELFSFFILNCSLVWVSGEG